MASLLLLSLLAGCGGDSRDDKQVLSPAPVVPPVKQGPDPLLARQWHLFNTGQSGGVPGMDVGLQGVNGMTRTARP